MQDIPMSLPVLTFESLIDTVIQILSDFISNNLKFNSKTHTPTDKKVDLPQMITAEIGKKRRIRSIWQRSIKTLLNRQTLLVRDLLHSNREK